MNFTYASSVSASQQAIIQEAIAACTFPLDHVTMDVTFEVSRTVGHGGKFEALTTTAPGSGSALVQIDPRLFDPSSTTFWVDHSFILECVVHELGHVVTLGVLTESQQRQFAPMFGFNFDTQWNSKFWRDAGVESVAETFKDAFLPFPYRDYWNRTHHQLIKGQLNNFVALCYKATHTGTAVPGVGSFRDTFSAASLRYDTILAANSQGIAECYNVPDPVSGSQTLGGQWFVGNLLVGGVPNDPDSSYVTYEGGRMKWKHSFADSDPGVPPPPLGFNGEVLDYTFATPTLYLYPNNNAAQPSGIAKVGVQVNDPILVELSLGDTTADLNGLLIETAVSANENGTYTLQAGDQGIFIGTLPAPPYYLAAQADMAAGRCFAGIFHDEALTDPIASIAGALQYAGSHPAVYPILRLGNGEGDAVFPGGAGVVPPGSQIPGPAGSGLRVSTCELSLFSWDTGATIDLTPLTPPTLTEKYGNTSAGPHNQGTSHRRLRLTPGRVVGGSR